MSGVVIVVHATVCDGQVVRWYRSLGAAERHREFLSASRNRVCVEAEVTDDLSAMELTDHIEEARKVMWALRDGQDCRHLATHHSVGFGDPLKPVAE
jgi:hypothetical protein